MAIRPKWYALGNLGSNIFSQAFATFALFFYIDHLRAPLGAITAAMAVQSVWHAVLNPAIGQWSDRTRTRFGRRIPYIAGLSLPVGILFFFLWHPVVSHQWLPAYFLFIVMFFDLTYLTVVLNWTSLFPEMFRSVQQRTRAQFPRQVVGVIALLIGVAAPPLLYGHLGWTAMGFILATIGTAGFFLSLFGSHEEPSIASLPHWSLWESPRILRHEQGFRQFLAMNFLVQLTLGLVPAVLPFYAKYVLHLSHSMLSLVLASIFVTAMILILPWTRLVRKIGSHQSIRWTIGWITAGLLPLLWAHGPLMVLVSAVFLGSGLAGFLTLADVLMAEIIDYDARQTGRRREGIFYGINGFILRLGVSVQALLLYIVLHSTGYHANAHGYASISVQDGFRALISGIPLVFMALAFWTIYRFSIPESVVEAPESLTV